MSYGTDQEFNEALDLHGMAVRSGHRSSSKFDRMDAVLGPSHDGKGLEYIIRDLGLRGREYYLTIGYEQIDADYRRRHGDEIAALEATIAERQATVDALTARLANVVRVARGDPVVEWETAA